MERIEQVTNPIIGKTYLVRCTRMVFRSSGILNMEKWTPIFGTWHCETQETDIPNNEYLEEKKMNPSYDPYHYHIDWRFMPEKVIKDQEELYVMIGMHLPIVKNTHLRSVLWDYDQPTEIKYLPLIYQRNFAEFDIEAFWGKNYFQLSIFKDRRMENFICPHKGTDLRNCKVKNNAVQCPAHGLTWDVHTGELVNRIL